MIIRVLVALLLSAFPGLAAAANVEFARDIQPILAQRCISCHSERTHMANLRLDTRAAADHVLTTGLLLRKVSGQEKSVMPPVGAPLTPDQIATFKAWIDAGAPWPASATFAKHWAFEPVKRPAVPANSGRTPIDRFILARLNTEHITPSAEAKPHTLLRRVALDLTGLPPSPEETAAYLADKQPGAYERAVDRLLASPHYGEKWARYWLDLAHYADSDGYEKDLVRPNAWRYRQWLIEALNRDLPYDQFTIQQLAGDELPGASDDVRIATGFLRNTLTNREAGVDRGEARFEQLIDRTGTVGTTFLGLTVRCAQCHDHKYDPISHRDFYQIFSFFNAAEEAEMEAPLPGENAPYQAALPAYLAKRDEILTEYGVPALQQTWEKEIRATMADPGKRTDWDFQVTEYRAGFDRADKVIVSSARKPRDSYRLTKFFVSHVGPVFTKDAAVSARMKEARAKLDALDATLPPMPLAHIMEDDATAAPAFIHSRGDYKGTGSPVSSNAPHFLPPMKADGPANRLALAKWIVSPENPLTARVAVNRYWQELFGRGIVGTSEDFGTQGDRPSHPELLDYLATEFVAKGWSGKQMIRTIVLSDAYRRNSDTRADLQEKDPTNILLARQSRLRLSAEAIRDEALTVSGLLSAEIGGKSVRPPQPIGVAELGYANSVKWKESTGADKYRRGLYIHYQRTTPYPFLVNFDEPDSNLTCTRRRSSNTPLQALNLLNDPVFYEAAEAFSKRISGIDDAFQIALNRPPTAAERARLETYGSNKLNLARVLLNLDEFITRE